MTEQNPTTTTYEIEHQELLTNDGGGHVLAWVMVETVDGEPYDSDRVFEAWAHEQDPPICGRYRVVNVTDSDALVIIHFDVTPVTSLSIERVTHHRTERDIAAISRVLAPTSDEG